jgi:16S rRNA (cytidine1402-2'-O)-methyltransferase
VFFESPERLLRLLEDLQRVCGGERQVAVAREITKIHEEFVRGTLLEVATYYRENPPRGEVTVVIGPSLRDSEENPLDQETARLLASALLARGLRPSAVAKEVTRRLGVSRNVAYRAAQEASEEDEREGEDNGPKSELE